MIIENSTNQVEVTKKTKNKPIKANVELVNKLKKKKFVVEEFACKPETFMNF